MAQAGVARGTFYLYFEDKRAVFSDLVDRFAGQLSMAIVRIVTDDAARSVIEQVRENIRAIIATCLGRTRHDEDPLHATRSVSIRRSIASCRHFTIPWCSS